MARTVATKQYNTFVKGLITEASPLTYPENASLDEDNFVLKRNGSRERRLGVDYETGYALVPTSLPAITIEGSRQSFHRWENPGGDTTVAIGVVRIYDKLWFVDLLTDAPSANLLNGGAAITITGLANAEIETTVINNYFILVSSDLPTPIALSYSKSLDYISQSEIPLQVRDLWGVNDSLNTDVRPTTLSKLHEYNLNNQGWSEKIQASCAPIATSTQNTNRIYRTDDGLALVLIGGTPYIITEDLPPKFYKNTNTYTPVNAIECTKSVLGVYPANSDIWTLGKVGDSLSPNFEKYDPNALLKNSVDNLEAPKGHFIIDAFNRGDSRNKLIGLTELPADKDSGSITTLTSFAGRVFYSGVLSDTIGTDSRSPNFSNYIFFSQVVTSADKLGRCYQEADPTSAEISDIVDTDGGTIQIPEATKIIKIISTKTSLLVFAENGIWEIFGDTNGFVATSYQTNKISSTGCSSPKSIVESTGTVFAWTKSGIYVVTEDQVSGRYKAENISLLSIQTFYNNLSEVAKNNARGFYDEKENTIRWLYNDQSTYSTLSFVNRYNRELILDLTLQAFYPQSVAATTPYVADYIDIPNYTVTSTAEAVYAGSDLVLSSTDEVIVNIDAVASRVTQFSFLTIVGTSFTFSKYNSRTFKDWYTYNGAGINYSSYLVTGYEMFGDVMRHKQVPYIWFYFTKTEDGFSTDAEGNLQVDNPSACLVKAKWNWTDSATSGQWGSQFQAYKFRRNYIPSGPADTFDNGFEVIVTKNKLRGYGRSLSLLVESEAGKDMKLLGWAVMAAAKATP